MECLNKCPKCNGEVEMVKLNKKKKSDPAEYRIWCKRCGLTVARGRGFPDEIKRKAEDRIDQYEKYLKELYYGNVKRKTDMESADS